MKRELLFLFVAAAALYLPSARYGFVQDDRAIIAANPAAHSVTAAIRAFDDPYWPRESGAGLYRPVTILTYAVDWQLSGGRAGWFHAMNALWHGLVTVLLTLILARWLPPLGATAAGLLFAWHPVHVEAVAGVVGRAELLAAAGICAAVLAARRGWWVAAVLCAGLAMFSKEHGVIAGVVILLDYWLQRTEERRSYPTGLWVALAFVTVGFLGIWYAIGRGGENDIAPVFYGRSSVARLAIALPAIWRAAVLLVWPASLSADYSPRVLALHAGFSLAALLGMSVIVVIVLLVLRARRAQPALAFAAGLAALAYLPTSNLLFPSGVLLAERNLYLAVVLPAALVGVAIVWFASRRGLRPAVIAAALVAVTCAARSLDRLPSWRDNRSFLLTLLIDHPESYPAHASAAAVFAGIGDTAAARRHYAIADSLFPDDPFLDAARAIFLLSVRDTAAAAALLAKPRNAHWGERLLLRARFLLEVARESPQGARAVADSALRRFPEDRTWYVQQLQ